MTQETASLTFLRLTKEGKYAVVDTSALPYARIEVQREETEDIYLYGMS